MDVTYSMMLSFVYMMNYFFMDMIGMFFCITTKSLNKVQGCFGIKFFVAEFAHIRCVACKLNILAYRYYYIQRFF